MIIKKLETEIIRIVKLPDVQKRLRGAELDRSANERRNSAVPSRPMSRPRRVARRRRSKSSSSRQGAKLSHAVYREHLNVRGR